MGAQAGGGGNFNRDSLAQNTYESIINENYYSILERETNLDANLEIFKEIVKNPFKNEMNYYLGMLIKSKYDGVGRKLDQIDIAIALDISGSMSSPFIPGPTFKETALDNVPDRKNYNGKKSRIEIAKECLYKMVNSMDEKVQMALTKFNHESQKIIDLSPKDEILSVINKIDSLKAEGGTNLFLALNGAAECLTESKAKFKRIIIITDGWNNMNDFNDRVKELSDKGIMTTVLAIESSCNSNMFDNFSDIKGCNYYFLLNETDMEKYLIKQFNYICFPCVHDLKISLKSDEADLIKAIGCGDKAKQEKDKNLDVELVTIKSIFPSDIKELNGKTYQEGGLILLKVNPKNKEKNCNFDIKLEYTTIEGEKVEKNMNIFFTADEMKNGVKSEQIHKGIACYYYNKFYRKMLKYLNINITFTNQGPTYSMEGKKSPKKVINFLSRNNENYDIIKMFFEANYENDINEYQKEAYIKNLDKKYNEVQKKMEDSKKAQNEAH